MANLEEYALKRDRRFLVRLVLMLLIGAAAGAFLFGKLTSTSTASCLAAQFVETPAAPPDGSVGSKDRTGDAP